jgi:GAF domain-containing protein
MAQDMFAVLQSIVVTALVATGATDGWVIDASTMRVVAAAGESAGLVVGRALQGGKGSAPFVIQSAQPIVLSPRGPNDESSIGVRTLIGRDPTSILSVPCSATGQVIGALELVDKMKDERFGFEDLELVSLLAGIAATALGGLGGTVAGHPTPESLSASLRALALDEPSRYATIAGMVALLVEHV